jgi:hypothetical protein
MHTFRCKIGPHASDFAVGASVVLRNTRSANDFMKCDVIA